MELSDRLQIFCLHYVYKRYFYAIFKWSASVLYLPVFMLFIVLCELLDHLREFVLKTNA